LKTEQNNESSTGEIITILLPFATVILAAIINAGNTSLAAPFIAGGAIATGVSAVGTYLHNTFSAPHSN